MQWYIAQYAHLQGKPCITHNWRSDFTSISNIRLVVAIPSYQVLEPCRHYIHFLGGLFKEPIVEKDSYANVPSSPGLGVDIIGDADKKFPYHPNNIG